VTRDFSEATVRKQVAVVDPTVTVETVETVERGRSAVFAVTVRRDGETADWFLKLAPDGEDGGIPADARLTALLGDRTDVPVPAVHGVVDDHPDLPTPYAVTGAVEGQALDYAEVGWLSDDAVRRLARETGAALGQLHAIDAVESFGLVRPADDRSYTGERPAGGVADLAVAGTDSWTDWLGSWLDRELDRHADSRFGDLTPDLRSWADSRLSAGGDSDREGIGEPERPVLGRNDHGLHNLLLDPETGEMRAMLDWAYTLAVAPAFDLHYAEYIYGGRYLAGIEGLSDRQSLVREALLAGYRAVAPERVERVVEPRPLYDLLASMRVMIDFDLLAPQLPEGTSGAVAERLRADTGRLLAGDHQYAD
jgi:aminoglycoside phosphotransferase (APT) family kinase protein